MGLSLSPELGHEERIREVLQEDRCSIMYSIICSRHLVHSRIMLLFLHSGILIRNTDGVYFRRLKINHDSHEFILESGTDANNYKKGYVQ